MRDFSSKTLRALARKGLTFLRPVAVPGLGDMPFANCERAYAFNDNGCHRILTFSQVLEAAQ
jgi:hypothetical protein